MIKKPIVLILGAGASKPYGLPLGGKLKELVAEELSNIKLERGVTTLKDFVKNVSRGTDINPYEIKDFGDRLKKTKKPSIDLFLFPKGNKKYIEIGKRAIALTLLVKEKPENLQPKEDWYGELYKELGNTVEQYEKSFENLGIITFNYDRSLEQYLYNNIKNDHKDKEHDEIVDIIDKLKIYHMYGSLGRIDGWDRDKPGIPYENLSIYEANKYLDQAANSIQIITEGEIPEENLVLAKELIKTAERICFLGFGYHEELMEQLFDGVNKELIETY